MCVCVCVNSETKETCQLETVWLTDVFLMVFEEHQRQYLLTESPRTIFSRIFFFFAERLVQISQIITTLILLLSQVLDPRSVGSGKTVFTTAMAHVSAAETFHIYSMSGKNAGCP